MRTAHTLHAGYGLLHAGYGLLHAGYGLLYGGEPISDDPKVGWVAKPNVFRQLSSLCWVFNPTYACRVCGPTTRDLERDFVMIQANQHKQSNTQYPWSEKSVEYKFVIQCLSKIYKDSFKIAPLDGDYEQAGDVILQNANNRYYLVEFKKGENCQYDEFKKFFTKNEWQTIKEKCGASKEIVKPLSNLLANNNSEIPTPLPEDLRQKIRDLQSLEGVKYHFVIFAQQSGKDLSLHAQKYKDYLTKRSEYISENEFIELFDNKVTFEKNTASRDEFLAYVHEFVSLKKGKELVIVDDGESSSAFANVLAINSEGQTCTLLDIINSKIYQNKYPLLNMEIMQQELDSILFEISQPDIILQRAEKLNGILGEFREYLNDAQENFENKKNIIAETKKSIDNLSGYIDILEKILEKLKIKLTPKETNSVKFEIK